MVSADKIIDWAESWKIENTGFLEEARKEILSLPREDFDRYENPFESKWVLRDKYGWPHYTLIAMLMLEESIKYARGVFSADLETDPTMHYRGVFIYEPGDQLSCHLDAGIHPLSGKRKHVTAIAYLDANGIFELWDGDEEGPKDKIELVTGLGKTIIFENNDKAWHSAAMNQTQEPRIVLTTSFVSNDIDRFKNKRQRAYFVPRPTETWTSEMYELRDMRADQARYAEAYRV